MITLPPGCTVTYGITVDVQELTADMIAWYELIGGIVTEQEWFSYRGQKNKRHFVQYGGGKKCHYYQDGTHGVRLHFLGKDASVASMFLMKFFDAITQHNLKEVMDRQEADSR
jgi:hypothetical protein